MATTTPNLGLILPASTDNVSRTDLNTNFTTIDTAFGALLGTSYQASTIVDITSYNSSSNYYTTPSEGYVRITNDGERILLAPGGSVILEGNGKIISAYVHKGAKIYANKSDGTSTTSAKFVPIS